ncbi:MAG: twin-arginine translocase subunit TatC [Atopobiaceae bacterium]|nr:twin-arginine translocase subunit TatC [Atopobiaceae bacterium]MCH4214397.1 twin-arginine translocase subunit TatC [Atopobiaceae bacterium]MCH4229172.1 twin-arginine translocase subunit TatC [Atopobiaceae bacterium]MCH4276543.1 twin-arginine translocase subunit TatC [Atopobiaceae bacterium]MCI1225937.1 twin-arginine translocase subunit TatC [Atopobiaceae bacterium]
MPIGPARMPLLDHLGELRRRLTIVVVALLVAAVIIYMATPALIEVLMDPIRQFLPDDGQLTVLSALGGFTIRFKVAIFFGMIVCSPIIIWEVMAFFLPAFTESERKWVVPTVAAMVALFFLGMIFCYFVILQAAFGWMIGESAAFATVTPNAEDYLSIMMMLEIGFGLAFQLPLVVFYLAIFHIVPYRDLRGNWRYIYVGLLVLSAVVTPDASPVTMFFMFAALISLYEISLAVARSVIVGRDGKEALKWTRDDYDQHEMEKDDVDDDDPTGLSTTKN